MAKHKTCFNNSKWSLLRCNINELSRIVDSNPKKICISTNYVLNLKINWKTEIHFDISNCYNIGCTTKYMYMLTKINDTY